MTRPGIDAAFRMATCGIRCEQGRRLKTTGTYSVEREGVINTVEVKPKLEVKVYVGVCVSVDQDMCALRPTRHKQAQIYQEHSAKHRFSYVPRTYELIDLPKHRKHERRRCQNLHDVWLRLLAPILPVRHPRAHQELRDGEQA